MEKIQKNREYQSDREIVRKSTGLTIFNYVASASHRWNICKCKKTHRKSHRKTESNMKNDIYINAANEYEQLRAHQFVLTI